MSPEPQVFLDIPGHKAHEALRGSKGLRARRVQRDPTVRTARPVFQDILAIPVLKVRRVVQVLKGRKALKVRGVDKDRRVLRVSVSAHNIPHDRNVSANRENLALKVRKGLQDRQGLRVRKVSAIVRRSRKKGHKGLQARQGFQDHKGPQAPRGRRDPRGLRVSARRVFHRKEIPETQDPQDLPAQQVPAGLQVLKAVKAFLAFQGVSAVHLLVSRAQHQPAVPRKRSISPPEPSAPHR